MDTHMIVRVLADGTILPIVLIAGYALLFLVPRTKRFEIYTRIFMAGLTAYLIAKLLGSIYQPSMERPFEVLGLAPGASYLDNPGFPSDHALFAAFLTLAVWFATKRRTLTLILAGLIIVMCVGRVLALVHTPLDVMGGVLIAGVGALWYLQDKSELTKPKTRKKHKSLVK